MSPANDNRRLFDEEPSGEVQAQYEALFANPFNVSRRWPKKVAEERCRQDTLRAIVIFRGQCTFAQWIDVFLYQQRWHQYFIRFAKTPEDREHYRQAYENNVGVWERTLALMGVKGSG
jgi:hypothetical protein